MRLIKIDNIVNTDEESSILYQRHYSAIAYFENYESHNETVSMSIIFMIEMNPINFKYYIRKIEPEIYSTIDNKNSLIREIENLHNSGFIDFEHNF